MDLCSPMVYGQTREEHDEYLRMHSIPSVDNILNGKKGTNVSFIFGGHLMNPPMLDVPYFPLVSSRHGNKLMEIKSKCSSASSTGQSRSGEDNVAHELCALQMFRARMDRERYVLHSPKPLTCCFALFQSNSIVVDILFVDDDALSRRRLFPCLVLAFVHWELTIILESTGSSHLPEICSFALELHQNQY